MALPEIIKDIEARVKDTGDTMTGNLTIKNTGPQLNMVNTNKAGQTVLYPVNGMTVLISRGAENDGNNHRVLYLNSPSAASSIKNGFRIQEVINGGSPKTYEILHQANYFDYALPLTGGTISGDLQIGNSSQTSLPTGGIAIHDLRNCTILPNSFGDRNANFYFYQSGSNGDWKGIIHIKGWNDTTYSAWEICGDAGISASEDFCLRSGVNGTWNPWRKILHSGNYTSYTPSKTGSGASGTWPISISGNATTATIATTATSANSLENKFYAGRNTPPNTTGVKVGMPPYVALALKNCGYGVHNDAEFASGTNNVSIYNNSGNGTVTVTRVADSTAANTSGYVIQIKHTGTASPGFGGFYQTISSRANAVFFQLFRAKIPVGYYIAQASNAMGTGYSDFWVTDIQGTGKWEWYGRIVLCGETGSFSSGGHVYLSANSGYASPTTSAPIIWYLSYCNCFDLTKGAYLNATQVHGAVWNDYAEFRTYKDSDKIPYGKVVIENGDDSLSLSTARLQLGGNICSDTFGFAIGETDNAKLPIAVSGRVLAYTNEPRDTYKPGEALCSGPNGTVSKMTREEIKEYPDAIIGYVSAVPDYEVWGTGNVKVDGRIWVKIK